MASPALCQLPSDPTAAHLRRGRDGRAARCGEVFDPDHDSALALGAAACVAAVIIGRWPARAARASAHQPNGDS